MRLALRSPLATLVPLLLLVPVAASTSACSGETEGEDGGTTVVATGPDRAKESATSAATDEGTTAGTDRPTSATADLPDALAAVCEPYVVMVRAIESAGFTGSDPDQIAAELAPVMKDFAARLPDLDQPAGMPDEAWRGITVLAARILELPDRPTYDEVEAVEGQLSEQDRQAVKTAAAWFKTSCPVT